MKKYILPFLFTFILLLIPKDTLAQSIMPTTIRVKSSDNSQVLADQSLDFFTNSPYYSTQIELPFSSPSLQYNTSYGIDLYIDFYVSYYNDWGNFGLDSPGFYISYNGLHGQAFNYNVFSNNLQNVSNVVGYYRLHLSGTFATNSQGTLYIAFPFSHAIDLYGAKVVSVDLNYYGSNTTNSDIIASNNQNTQNIITNNNNNTQSIINNQNNNTQTISNEIIDSTAPNSEEINTFVDTINMISFGPISQLLQIPIRLIERVVEWFNLSCSPISLGRLYGHDISMSCIDIKSIIGNEIYTMCDFFIALFCYYELFMYVIHVYDKFTDFSDDFHDLYRRGAIH